MPYFAPNWTVLDRTSVSILLLMHGSLSQSLRLFLRCSPHDSNPFFFKKLNVDDAFVSRSLNPFALFLSFRSNFMADQTKPNPKFEMTSRPALSSKSSMHRAKMFVFDWSSLKLSLARPLDTKDGALGIDPTRAQITRLKELGLWWTSNRSHGAIGYQTSLLFRNYQLSGRLCYVKMPEIDRRG